MQSSAHLYFIRAADGSGHVKIGRSSNPEKRLSSLNGGSPVRLTIAAVAHGWGEYERRFHALFARVRCHGEWFLPDPEIDSVILAIQQNSFDLTLLPAAIGESRGADGSAPVRLAKSLLDELGSYTEVAAKIGVAPGVVATWRSRNAIPRSAWPDLMLRYPRKAKLAALVATEAVTQ